MKSRTKSITLFLIILLGLFPPGPASAVSPAQGSLDESLALLYASRSILLGEIDLEEANRSQDALLSVQPQDGNDAGKALGHLIHATKQQRNELNNSCRALKAAYRAEGKTCELQILTEYCEAEEAKLNSRIGLLHRLRGDRRRFLTRVWHNVKSASDQLWSSIGRPGRRIVREVSSKAVEVVLSGGSLSGGMVRKLLIKEVGQAELNRLLERGISRMLQRGAALAQAAGVTKCTDENLEAARQQVAGDVGEPVDEIQVQPVPGEGSGEESCLINGQEFESFWQENIYPALVRESRNCNIGDVNDYKYCLRDQMVNEEECYPEAQAACNDVYRNIPRNLSGTIPLDIGHSEAEGVAASILLSTESDAVTGNLRYVMNDMNKCTITVTGSFQGTVDKPLCTMSGNGKLTFTYNGTACASVCSSGPNSEAACPVTVSGGATWQASIKNGELVGGIGCGDSSAPGCVGFSGGN